MKDIAKTLSVAVMLMVTTAAQTVATAAQTVTAAALAATTLGVPTQKGEACTFQENVRYSELVINSRINDFKANKKLSGFGIFNDKGEVVQKPNNTGMVLDYVPGLVALAIMEAVDYYLDISEVDVKPWFYAIQNYGCSYDIAEAGKQGMNFDDLNAVKLYFRIRAMAADNVFDNSPKYTNQQTVKIADERMAAALQGIKKANETYVIQESTLAAAAGGWWHKSTYTDQMWCDGQYMGPALLAKLISSYSAYQPISDDDWALLVKQFSIAWSFLWNQDTQLLYHAFTADPGGTAAKDWKGVSATPDAEVYHSAEYWGRAVGWYFLALVDVLEQLQQANLTESEHYQTLQKQLNLLAAGIAAHQDADTGCWRQLLNHDGDYTAEKYNPNYSYTTKPVKNYLESSCSALFIAGYLKGMRLHLFDKDYTTTATKAYQGFINAFMVSDGNGGVHLVKCCKSAGLGGTNYRDGSAEYYLMGKDTEPTVSDPTSTSFYTEGKVLGAFILAAVEYERLQASPTSVAAPHFHSAGHAGPVYNLAGQQVSIATPGIKLTQENRPYCALSYK